MCFYYISLAVLVPFPIIILHYCDQVEVLPLDSADMQFGMRCNSWNSLFVLVSRSSHVFSKLMLIAEAIIAVKRHMAVIIGRNIIVAKEVI